MTKEQIIAARALYQGNSEGLVININNVKFISELQEGTSVIWDDTLELLHVVRPNVSAYNQGQSPITVDTIHYDIVESITTVHSITELETMLGRLKTQGLIDDTEINEIVLFYKDLK